MSVCVRELTLLNVNGRTNALAKVPLTTLFFSDLASPEPAGRLAPGKPGWGRGRLWRPSCGLAG